MVDGNMVAFVWQLLIVKKSEYKVLIVSFWKLSRNYSIGFQNQLDYSFSKVVDKWIQIVSRMVY